MKNKSIWKEKPFWSLLAFLFFGVGFAIAFGFSIAYQVYWAQWLFFSLFTALFLFTAIMALILHTSFSKKQGEAVDSLKEQISSFRGGSMPLLSLDEKKLGVFLPLQESINAFLENYSRFEIVAKNTSQDKTVRDQIALGHVFREEDFKKNLYFELQSTHSSRSALLMFALESKKEDPSKEKSALLQAIRSHFPGSMIGEREGGFSCFVYQVGAILALKTSCQRMAQDFCLLDLGEGESVSYCKIGGVIYPYVSMSDLYAEAEKALRESDDVNIVSSLDRFYFPRTILTENNKLVIYEGFLETSKSHFQSLPTRVEKIALLSSLFTWASSTLGLSSGGYLTYDPESSEYRVEMDVGRNGENLSFGKLGQRIPSKILDPLFEEASSDLYFAVGDVEKLPGEYASFLKNIGISSLFLRSIEKSGKKVALLFLCGDQKAAFDSLLTHSILDSFASFVGDVVYQMEGEKRLEGSLRLLDALSTRTHRYLYSIDRATHRLSFLSDDLKKAYPEAHVGDLCYRAFHRGNDAPCSYCPLTHGSCSRLFQELSTSPCSYSVLEYRGSYADRSTLLLEPQGVDSSALRSSRLVDEAFMIRNQQALALVVNRDCKNRNPGYVLATRINNFASLAESLPETDATSLFGQIVKNFQDAGYEDLIYRFDEDTLAFFLPSYTKTKAISFVEEVAEIYAIPLESGAQSKLCDVSYALIAYPGDVSNARQLVTLVQNDMKRCKELGSGYLVDQSGSAPRKAKRSEFVTFLLKEAIEKEKMRAFLQPIVDGKTLRPIVGDIRAALYGPDKSEIAPAEFIPLAEKAGLVSRIDVSSFQAMGELFSQYGYTIFRNVGLTHLAIYLSLDSLLDQSFPGQVKKAFSQYHFPKGYVQFEIKAAYLSKNAEAVKKLQTSLSSLALEWVASEFNYERGEFDTLKEFGIKTIKTDRLVVANAVSSPRDGTSFARFCSDAQKAGIAIVATGVETEEQCKFLSHLGVYAMEGYYFGRPMNEEDFINYVAYGSDPNRR